MKKTILFSVVTLILVLNQKSNAQTEFQLREQVNEYVTGKMPGLQTALIAEAVRGDFRIAIAWPCAVEGEIIDDDIIGLVYKKKASNWEFLKEIGAFKGDGKQQIAEAIGGEDFEIIKPNGMEKLDELPTYIAEQAKQIKGFLDKRENANAVEAIERLSQLFDIKLCGYDDTFAELVLSEILMRFPIELKDFNTKKNTTFATIPFMNGPIELTLTKNNNAWTITEMGQ